MEPDYLAEIREILGAAAGVNDNALPSPAPAAGVVFNGPVTVNVTIGADAPEAGLQRMVLIERLRGYLAAEGEAVAAAFQAEVTTAFGLPLADLADQQLADLLRGFSRMIRTARMLAASER